MNLFKKFVEINQNICRKIEKILPHTKPDITEVYSQVCSEYINKQNQIVIADIGAGRITPYVKYINKKDKYKLIVIDENIDELKKNIDADQIIVADVDKKLPLDSSSIDLVTSRYVFEHLEDLPAFISNSKQILKKGGQSIHLFSCKFAIFALLNQLIPQKSAKILLNNLVPGSQHIRGFKTNYDLCYYDSIVDIFTKSDFTIEKIYLSYYQSRYFSFFLPFYLLSVLFELLLYSLQLKNLCAYLLIVAEKMEISLDSC